jgi:hypothetical protein
MNDKYDKLGNPIDFMTWAKLREDKSYKRVALDRVGEAEVSTVWLGLDHNFGGGPPLIFETIVFGGERDQDCQLYSTEEQARAGHARIVAELSAIRS